MGAWVCGCLYCMCLHVKHLLYVGGQWSPLQISVCHKSFNLLLTQKVCLLQLPNYVISKKSGRKTVGWH